MVAGIACVRFEMLERLQKMSQAFAGHRRGRGKNRPTERGGDQSRRSLRLLLVMHLHDRHGAHLTLQTRLKQARQSPAQPAAEQTAAAFPYSAHGGLDSLGFSGIFVNISLRRVTQSFHFRKFCQTSAN
jgi:hypothetical protein